MKINIEIEVDQKKYAHDAVQEVISALEVDLIPTLETLPETDYIRLNDSTGHEVGQYRATA